MPNLGFGEGSFGVSVKANPAIWHCRQVWGIELTWEHLIHTSRRQPHVLGATCAGKQVSHKCHYICPEASFGRVTLVWWGGGGGVSFGKQRFENTPVPARSGRTACVADRPANRTACHLHECCADLPACQCYHKGVRSPLAAMDMQTAESLSCRLSSLRPLALYLGTTPTLAPTPGECPSCTVR